MTAQRKTNTVALLSGHLFSAKGAAGDLKSRSGAQQEAISLDPLIRLVLDAYSGDRDRAAASLAPLRAVERGKRSS